MRRSCLLALFLPLLLAGCISFSSSDPNPPQKTTVVTPPNSTTVVTPPPNSTVICTPAPC